MLETSFKLARKGIIFYLFHSVFEEWENSRLGFSLFRVGGRHSVIPSSKIPYPWKASLPTSLQKLPFYIKVTAHLPYYFVSCTSPHIVHFSEIQACTTKEKK